jgi:hypothetical protein
MKFPCGPEPGREIAPQSHEVLNSVVPVPFEGVADVGVRRGNAGNMRCSLMPALLDLEHRLESTVACRTARAVSHREELRFERGELSRHAAQFVATFGRVRWKEFE